jgi:hypothetical protein
MVLSDYGNRTEIHNMTRGDYTVEVYKADKRTRSGERLVLKRDHTDIDLQTLRHSYFTTWFKKDGYRLEIYETYVTRVNLMSGVRFRERYDTPRAASPSSESYWSS